MSAVRLSVVVPVYNEAGVVKELVERCSLAARDAVGASFELLVVDDASDDRTPEVLRELSDPRLRVLRLKQNSGQYRATRAGLKAASGEWIAVLDGDLQDPPELIPKLFSAARESECVFAVKTARAETGFLRLGHSGFHLVQSLLGGASPPRGAGSYCLMKHDIAAGVAAVDLKNANIAAVAARVLKKKSAGSSVVEYQKSRRYDEKSRVGTWGLVREALGSFFVSGALGRLLAVLSGLSLIVAAVLTAGGAGPLFFVFAGLGAGLALSAVLVAVWSRMCFSNVPAGGRTR
jgi:glycosyltransferase involved in cell wall biosynthesis